MLLMVTSRLSKQERTSASVSREKVRVEKQMVAPFVRHEVTYTNDSQSGDWGLPGVHVA